MVVLSSCPVFTVLLVVGVVVFFTSYMALDSHVIKESSGPSSPRDRFSNRLSDTSSSFLTAITELLKEEAGTPTVDSTCHLSFPPKCSISKNLIRYWEEDTGCFKSPLRDVSGLGVKNADRRFVVFQPDLGGWNNIRMALEVSILFAHVTGRILVLPPHAVLYLLNRNKKWGDNKASMEDFLDFDRIKAGSGMQTMTMKEFLTTQAIPGLLSKPLPKNNTDMLRQPLWDYLESACYVRQWAPGKTFIGFNLSHTDAVNDSQTVLTTDVQGQKSVLFGNFHKVEQKRLTHISLDLQRQLIPYDKDFHSQRAIYFPGHDSNRILTLWYGYFLFAEGREERAAKRFMRDRVRYHDVIFCAAGRVVDLLLEEVAGGRNSVGNGVGGGSGGDKGSKGDRADMSDRGSKSDSRKDMEDVTIKPLSLVSYKEGDTDRVYRFLPINASYMAFHIRRGDFQQKQTRLEGQDIVDNSLPLIPGDPKTWTVYISTDETNRTFFLPFIKTFKSVRFLSDYTVKAGIQEMNQNHLGMVEQVVCSNAHTFIGTPLSTFTSYITRMRGYIGRHTLVEVPPLSADTLLTRLLRHGEQAAALAQEIKEKKKTKFRSRNGRGKKRLLWTEETVRVNQIGRRLVRVSQTNERKVGKVYKRKVQDREVVSYSKHDSNVFLHELYNNKELFAQRFMKTIAERPYRPIPFINDTLILQVKKASSNARVRAINQMGVSKVGDQGGSGGASEGGIQRGVHGVSEGGSEGLNPNPTSTPAPILGVGMYERSYYFMGSHMFQLQDEPHLHLPFWVREFSEPFEDTEEEEELKEEKDIEGDRFGRKR